MTFFSRVNNNKFTACKNRLLQNHSRDPFQPGQAWHNEGPNKFSQSAKARSPILKKLEVHYFSPSSISFFFFINLFYILFLFTTADRLIGGEILIGIGVQLMLKHESLNMNEKLIKLHCFLRFALICLLPIFIKITSIGNEMKLMIYFPNNMPGQF